MSSPVRVVVGGNSHAAAVQLPALAHIGGNEIVGIAGLDGAKAARTARQWNIGRSSTDWRELLELAPDLVIVSTPVDLHYAMVRDALATGAAVMCEKPFTLDSDQAAELVQRAGAQLALVGHQLRWNPCRRQIRELCRDGFVGDIRHVRADLVLDTPNFAHRPHSWWSEAARGGGVTGALGVHLIDNIQWMFAPIESVSAHFETLVPSRLNAAGVAQAVTSEDHAELRLHLEGGTRATVTVSMALRGVGRWLLEIAGTDGSLRLDREMRLVGGRHGDAPAPIACDTRWFPPEQYGIHGKGPFAALEAIFLRDVIVAVAGGASELPEAASFDDGRRNVRVLEAARASALDGGRWIACAPRNETADEAGRARPTR
jgi:predicted dehydrogenase